MTNSLFRVRYKNLSENRNDEVLLPIIISDEKIKSHSYMRISFYSGIQFFSIYSDKHRRLPLKLARLNFLDLCHILDLYVTDHFEVGSRKNSTSESS
jgi:hypothetical protein